MPERRRVKQVLSLEDRIFREVSRLREEAKSLPPGARREELIRKARQAEAGLQLAKSLKSPAPQSSE